MRLPNKELESQILNSAIELLAEKEPVEIGMRDIAKKCNVSATSIYNYFKDKNEVFMKISLSCISELKDLMSVSVTKIPDPVARVKKALEVYRDWCFAKPKIAILVFSKLEENIGDEQIMNFYICNKLGENLLAECLDSGKCKSENLKLDTGIAISGLWGCIESIITKRADPEFWNEGKKFTDRFIEIFLDSVMKKEEEK